MIDFSKPMVIERPCGKNRKVTVTVTFENKPSSEAIQSAYKAIVPGILEKLDITARYPEKAG